MSGGSMDYLYEKVDRQIHRILQFGNEYENSKWLAFSKHLLLVSEALKDCEWVLSGDHDCKGADEAISKVITEVDEMKAVVEELDRKICQAQAVLKKLEKERGL